ncbi:MAG: hypothetical protein ACUVWV_08465 [Thermodesulfobacteriota bacterium]
MGGRDDEEEREKLSWREIDKLRDRSRHVRGEPKSYRERSLKSEWARKQHLREAEKFFQGVKGTAAYKRAYNTLHEKYGSPEFPQALRTFLEQFGLPDDWGTLLLVLDYADPTWIKESLHALKNMYPSRSLLEQKGFKGKIRILATTTQDKQVRAECAKILEEFS